MREWINITDEKPGHGEVVLVFRPNVLVDDHTDKPIRCAKWDGSSFDCFHQPTEWMRIKKPDSWNDALESRQSR